MSTTQNVLGRFRQLVVNPVRMAWDLGVPIPGDALLETTGRRTDVRRRTPVGDGLESRTSKALHTIPLTIRVDLDDK